jgi:hypothetical protein
MGPDQPVAASKNPSRRAPADLIPDVGEIRRFLAPGGWQPGRVAGKI